MRLEGQPGCWHSDDSREGVQAGPRGFFGMGKIQIDEMRYQIKVQLVEVGFKPKA